MIRRAMLSFAISISTLRFSSSNSVKRVYVLSVMIPYSIAVIMFLIET